MLHLPCPLAPTVLRAAVGVLVSALLPAAAWAEASPYALTVSQSVRHDSNLLRLTGQQTPPVGLSRADTVATTSLVGSLDQPIGRQRLLAMADLDLNRYSKNSSYNDLGYALMVGADWDTINRLSGQLRASAERVTRPDLRDQGNGVVTTDNAQSTRRLSANVVYGGRARLALEAGVAHRQLRYSAGSSRFRHLDEDTLHAAVRHQFSAGLNAGALLRHTRSSYPFLLSSLPDSRDRRRRTDIGVTSNWTPTATSRVQAQLAHTQVRHDQLSGRDYTAPTGALSWAYTPGGRWRLDASLARWAGQDELSTSSSALSRTSDTASLRGEYQITGKTTLNAGLRWTRRDLQGGTGNLSGSDTGHGMNLGVVWQASRGISVGCELTREQRGRNSSGLVDESFNANGFGCSASLTLR